MRPRQNGCHFTDDTFKRVFFNENVRVLINISLKFVPKDPINNISALVLIMAWCRPGDKTLSEPMMVSLLRHICVTRPQECSSLNMLIHDIMITAAHAVCTYYYTHHFNEVERGVYWFHVVRPSVRLSIRLWTKSCPLCIFHNNSRIHFIFAHLINQLEKVYRV